MPNRRVRTLSKQMLQYPTLVTKLAHLPQVQTPVCVVSVGGHCPIYNNPLKVCWPSMGSLYTDLLGEKSALSQEALIKELEADLIDCLPPHILKQ